MAELFAQAEIAAPVQRVWSLLADFGNIQAWWPSAGPLRIERVVLELQPAGAAKPEEALA